MEMIFFLLLNRYCLLRRPSYSPLYFNDFFCISPETWKNHKNHNSVNLGESFYPSSESMHIRCLIIYPIPVCDNTCTRQTCLRAHTHTFEMWKMVEKKKRVPLASTYAFLRVRDTVSSKPGHVVYVSVWCACECIPSRIEWYTRALHRHSSQCEFVSRCLTTTKIRWAFHNDSDYPLHRNLPVVLYRWQRETVEMLFRKKDEYGKKEAKLWLSSTTLSDDIYHHHCQSDFSMVNRYTKQLSFGQFFFRLFLNKIYLVQFRSYGLWFTS